MTMDGTSFHYSEAKPKYLWYECRLVELVKSFGGVTVVFSPPATYRTHWSNHGAVNSAVNRNEEPYFYLSDQITSWNQIWQEKNNFTNGVSPFFSVIKKQQLWNHVQSYHH